MPRRPGRECQGGDDGLANPARVAACRALGAEVVTPDGRTAFEMVEAISRDEGRSFIHPFEGPFTALGTATRAWNGSSRRQISTR